MAHHDRRGVDSEAIFEEATAGLCKTSLNNLHTAKSSSPSSIPETSDKVFEPPRHGAAQDMQCYACPSLCHGNVHSALLQSPDPWRWRCSPHRQRLGRQQAKPHRQQRPSDWHQTTLMRVCIGPSTERRASTDASSGGVSSLHHVQWWSIPAAPRAIGSTGGDAVVPLTKQAAAAPPKKQAD